VVFIVQLCRYKRQPARRLTLQLKLIAQTDGQAMCPQAGLDVVDGDTRRPDIQMLNV
jgi:hypothetical protein